MRILTLVKHHFRLVFHIKIFFTVMRNHVLDGGAVGGVDVCFGLITFSHPDGRSVAPASNPSKLSDQTASHPARVWSGVVLSAETMTIIPNSMKQQSIILKMRFSFCCSSDLYFCFSLLYFLEGLFCSGKSRSDL